MLPYFFQMCKFVDCVELVRRSCLCAEQTEHSAMKADVWMGVYIHALLTFTPVGGEWSASRPCRFTPERAPCSQSICWLDPRAALDEGLVPPGTRIPTPRPAPATCCLCIEQTVQHHWSLNTRTQSASDRTLHRWSLNTRTQSASDRTGLLSCGNSTSLTRLVVVVILTAAVFEPGVSGTATSHNTQLTHRFWKCWYFVRK
jgi:hypothetical protein